MTAATRLSATLGIALAIVLGTGVPASARFADTAGLPTMSAGTATIAAPTQTEAKLLCTTTPQTLKIEWWRSASRGVTGYTITAHPAAGAPYQLVTTGPTDEAYITADAALISSNPTFTITTVTSYGWTATSAKVGMTRC